MNNHKRILAFIAIYVWVIACFAALFLTGCSTQPDITEGTVIDKTYDPPHDKNVTKPGSTTCTGTGAKRRCRTGSPTTKIEHDDADWDIVIQKCEKGKKNDCPTATVEIDNESVWESIEVGDYYKP